MLKNRMIKWIVAAILACTSISLANATVCRLPGLEGFSVSAIHAKQFLPNQTRIQSKASVYIENTLDGLYFHSNFVSQGAVHPTKIGREKIEDGAFAFVNIVHTSRPSDVEWAKTEQTFRNDVEVILDKSVFDRNGNPLINLEGVKNIKVVDGSKGTYISATGNESFTRNRPPPLIIKKLLGCCLYGVPPHKASFFKKSLKNRRLSSKNIKVMSLVRDSATLEVINSSPILKRQALKNNTEINSIKDVEAQFANEKNGTVILVGHTEGSKFVTRSSANKEIFSVEARELSLLAKKYNIELIKLGCETAKNIERETWGIGVATKFNTVEAFKGIEKSLKGSKNYAEFFEKLTSDGLKVVLDSKFIDQSNVRAEIYSKNLAREVWIKVAEVLVTLNKKAS